MNPETIVYLLISGCILLLFKIVWDWLIGLKKSNDIKEEKSNSIKEICKQRIDICKQKMDLFDDDISRLYERLEKIEEKLEVALDKINRKIDEKFELLIKMLTQDRS